MNPIRAWNRFWFAPVSARPLGAFRVVFGLLKTDIANSPAVGPAQVWITLDGFTLLYGVLAVIAGRVFLKAVRKGPVEAGKAEDPGQELALAY